MTFQKISQQGKECLKTAGTLLRAAQTVTDRAIAGRCPVRGPVTSFLSLRYRLQSFKVGADILH